MDLAMIKDFGGIIQLNRLQLKLKLDYVAYKTKISKSQLSRIERNKEKVTLENAIKIFSAMDIKLYEEDINEEFEKAFESFYEDIFYGMDYKTAYENIKKYNSVIQSSFSYVKYLLGEMIYKILLNEDFDINDYLIIESYLDYLESYQIQLFYDYLGVYSYLKGNLEKEIEYYNLALRYKGNSYSKAMVYFHKSMPLTTTGNLKEALECALDARNVFAKTVNLKRLVSVNFQIATIYFKNGNYQEAEKLNLSCIDAFETLGMMQEVGLAYNNLIWSYIQNEQFDKVIKYEKEALDKMQHNHCIYFYLSYAYYKCGDKCNAIQLIKKARLCLKDPTPYMKTMIEAFQVYLSKSSFSRKEKKLLKAYNAAISCQDYELEIFTLELLIEFYRDMHEVEKEYDSMKKLLLKYKS